MDDVGDIPQNVGDNGSMANVDLSKYKEFEDKSFLVVDDFPEFRTAIKRMVEAFGGVNIETVSNGEDAILKLKQKKYDVVLCDYNLGEQKDGQQVLEEGKMMGAIQPSQIFLLLTAENTAEMVMGALEYEPDGYLVKPFNKEMVYNRLTKVISKKKELMPVYVAIEKKDFDKALEICNENLAAGGKYSATYLKLKGKILFELKRFDEACEFYQSLLQSKRTPWMLAGLGKAQYELEKYDKALESFRGIIELSDVNVEGYDWIAKTQIKRKEPDTAQSTLQHAIGLSSKAILRQQALADLSYDNKDYTTALKAYKHAVHLGKHSCYRRPADFIRYAILLLEQIPELGNDRDKARFANDALASLEQLALFYRSSQKEVVTSKILQIPTYQFLFKNDKASNIAADVQKEIDKTENLDLDAEIWTKYGEALIALGEVAKGQKIINQYEKKAS